MYWPTMGSKRPIERWREHGIDLEMNRPSRYVGDSDDGAETTPRATWRAPAKSVVGLATAHGFGLETDDEAANLAASVP